MSIKTYLITLLDLKKKLLEIEYLRKEDLTIQKIHKTEKDIILKDLDFFKTYVEDVDNIIYRINTLKIEKIANIKDFSNKKIKKKVNMSLDEIIIDVGKKSKFNGKPVDLGYGNYYNMKTIKNKEDIKDIEYNTLFFVENLKQVIIKIGNPFNNTFKVINTQICKVYNSSKYNIDNSRSIICNNNIKEKGLKCNILNCNYYHDPFLGYEDNYHTNRQYSNNPIVYNNPNFKNGEDIKDNIKKIKWHESITLYQSSLMNLLIACAHSSVQKSENI